MKPFFLPCPFLPVTSPSHLPKNEKNNLYCPTTHTQPIISKCVCTRLPAHKSFSGMDECIQPIHHLPYPLPLPLFLYQAAVTWQLMALSRRKISLYFSFFSLPSASLALHLHLTVYTLVEIHVHFLTSLVFLLLAQAFFLTLFILSLSRHPSFFFFCIPLGPKWYLQSRP